jgi:signal transduction histidine kinase/ligand-binding sensor domain-containing protein
MGGTVGNTPRRQFVGLGTMLACILLAGRPCALALDPSLDVNQYAHSTWKVRDGFVKGAISSLAQTPDGYVWLGTELGLLRFDGVRPVPWEPPAGQHLPATLITTLLSARDGTLWIGTFKGLASWKDGKLGQVSKVSGGDVVALLETRDGTVWIGTYALSGGRLCDIRSGVVHCKTTAAGVKALYEDSKGTLWVGLENGIWRWKPGNAEFFSLTDEPFGIISFAEDEQGNLLFGGHAGIRRLVDGRVEPYPSSSSVNRWQVTQMLRDHDGGLWVGTSEHGLVHIQKQGRTDVFYDLDGLSGDYVTRFLEDREGSIWVSTFDGLDRFRAYASSRIGTKQGLSNNTAWSVLASRDGSVWIATDSALNHWVDGQISLFGNGRGAPKSDGKVNGKPPISLFEDSGQRLWVSNSAGELGYLRDNRWIPIAGLPAGVIYSMTEVPSGHLWVTNQRAGLFELFEGHVQRQMPWAGLGRTDFAKVILADPSQQGLWLGFSDGGIAHFADGKIRESYSAGNGLGEGSVTDLRFGSRGALWAATASGVSRIKDGHVATLTSKNGLPCDKVIATMEDNDHATWLYLACGLVRVTQAELDVWVADPKRVISFTLFDTTDGVRGHVASGGFQPLMAKSADGTIWFLPWDGVSAIDPHHIPFNKLPPPVHIEQVIADGKPYDAADGLRLPPHVRNLAIDYTALSFVAPGKIHFRYKLEGQDPDWREVVNDRRVAYSNLAPRHYTFRVVACNNSGVWNEAGTFLDFSIDPAYYQTAWFRALCVAAFFVLLWALDRYRLHQIAQKYDVRMEERTRIARDLHDTLLQSFHGLMFRFQAARNMLPGRMEDAIHALDGALDHAEQAIAEGRDAIQDLRSSPAIQSDLAIFLTATGQELARSPEVNRNAAAFRLTVEGVPHELSPILQDEVCRIAREVLRNAFRHAHAHHIEAEIRYDDRSLRLRIRDDGAGIDPKILEQGGRPGHWGLLGINERAKRIGARLDLWSEAGAGTEAELTVPASVAYGTFANGPGFRLFRKKPVTPAHRS